jgi:glycosyltransferase involved in cell wall biosynthesis
MSSSAARVVPPSRLSIWFPTIRAGSGADVYVERLVAALQARGVAASITWFPHWYEFVPALMARVKAPPGTTHIHTNSNCGFPFRRHGLPLVITEHHYVLDPGYRPYKSGVQAVYHRCWVGPCLWRSYRAATAIVTPSRFTDGVLRSAFPQLSTTVIPHWLDYDRFVPAPVRTGHGPFRLLFVGNASQRKGADVVVALAKRLGEGFEIVCTSGLRRDGGLMADNIRILGRLSEAGLVNAYRDCDVVLVPSRYEGFGYSALEAMACARPVVAFRCGAIAEVVEEGRTALLADIDDLDALEAHCRALAASPERCRALGEAGRTRAVSRFDQNAAIDTYLALYASLLPQ